MDLQSRIRRRQRRDDALRLIQDYHSVSPVAHIDEPSDRGPVLERLLDHLDPVFDGKLPPNAYVYGPFGSGKSAVVTALFTQLGRLALETRSVIHTSTRAEPATTPGFVYVDIREATSEFAFYHSILDALVDESVPEHGIGTSELTRRLHELLERSQNGVVLAVDHVGEPDSADTGELVQLFAGLPSNLSWLAIGRTPPEETPLTRYTATAIEVEPYRRQVLVDVLMTRASKGLSQQALDHELARRLAEWAEGNAHDALAALFVAADNAAQAERTRLTEADIELGMGSVPRSSVSLGRVMALPENKQAVLRALLDLSAAERSSVTATTEAISALPSIDLSPGTVKRFLYEMAEVGIVERVQSEVKNRKGRPPSRLEPRFPTVVFRRLYDSQYG